MQILISVHILILIDSYPIMLVVILKTIETEFRELFSFICYEKTYRKLNSNNSTKETLTSIYIVIYKSCVISRISIDYSIKKII